jgi:hypothetical protein
VCLCVCIYRYYLYVCRCIGEREIARKTCPSFSFSTWLGFEKGCVCVCNGEHIYVYYIIYIMRVWVVMRGGWDCGDVGIRTTVTMCVCALCSQVLKTEFELRGTKY